MGWLAMERTPGMTDREFFSREFGDHIEIVECATKGMTFYAAVRHVDDPDRVGAVIVALQRGRRGDGFNFAYKDMSEDMGPCAAEAPAKVLDALTATESEHALKWRQRCRTRLQDRAARPRVRAGDTVVFAQPLTFTDDSVHDTFTYEGRGTTFRVGYRRFRIPRWRDREYRIVDA